MNIWFFTKQFAKITILIDCFKETSETIQMRSCSTPFPYAILIGWCTPFYGVFCSGVIYTSKYVPKISSIDVFRKIFQSQRYEKYSGGSFRRNNLYLIDVYIIYLPFDLYLTIMIIKESENIKNIIIFF